MNIPKIELANMGELANGFAKERASEFTTALEQKVVRADGNVIWDRDLIRKCLGSILAIAFAKGYADCYERKNIKKLLL